MSASVLFVGFGQRGRQWHQIAATRGDCQMAGVVDSDDSARAAGAAKGLAAWATLDEALAASSPTAAIIATPPALHATQAIACLDAGLRVLIEKPLALSLRDAAAVADAADAAGRPAVVGHNFRHRALERTLRRAVRSGHIGQLRAATIFTARPALVPAYEQPECAALWDLGVHHLDLLRGRFGGTPDLVDARAWSGADGLTFALHLEWGERAVADYCLREGASVYHHAEWLEGPRGAVRSVDGRAWLVTTSRRPRRLRARSGPAAERVLLDALLDSDAGGLDAREALGTIAIVEASIRSLALQQPVQVTQLTTAQSEAHT